MDETLTLLRNLVNTIDAYADANPVTVTDEQLNDENLIAYWNALDNARAILDKHPVK
jgi:hypothetical protein